MKYILIVEDDTALREGLITALQSDTLLSTPLPILLKHTVSCVRAHL